MGIVMFSRRRMKQNWDLWKLKTALDNFATRGLARRLVQAAEAEPGGMEAILDSYVQQEANPRGSLALRMVLPRLLPMLFEALDIAPADARKAMSSPPVKRTLTPLSVSKVMAYNFIPTGRATGIVDQDLTPEMREETLEVLYEYAANGGSVCGTAPRLGRVCMAHARPDLMPLAHASANRIKSLETP